MLARPGLYFLELRSCDLLPTAQFKNPIIFIQLLFVYHNLRLTQLTRPILHKKEFSEAYSEAKQHDIMRPQGNSAITDSLLFIIDRLTRARGNSSLKYKSMVR